MNSQPTPATIIPRRSYGTGLCPKHGLFDKINANQKCCSNVECQRVWRNEQCKLRARKKAKAKR